MLIACGIWGLLDPHCGGTSELRSYFPGLKTLISYSFLIKDAQDDIAVERLKS
jgi:hypothetical protein